VRAFDAEFSIPKRAVTLDQEKDLRDLVRPTLPQRESARGDAIECSFFLTQDDLNEESATHQGWLQRWLRTKPGRFVGRAICGVGALWFLWLPAHMGKSWAEEFRTEPGVTVVLMGLALLGLFVAAGCPGLKALNFLGQQRRARISDLEVEVTRGAKSSIHKWKRFYSYQETQNLFLLRTQIGVQLLTIPKRSLQPGDEEKLRALLDRNLPRQ